MDRTPRTARGPLLMIMHLTRRMISKFVSHTIVLAAGVFVGSMTVLMPRSRRLASPITARHPSHVETQIIKLNEMVE
jgi:hypothetical protein